MAKTTNPSCDRCVIMGRIFFAASTAEHFDRIKLREKFSGGTLDFCFLLIYYINKKFVLIMEKLWQDVTQSNAPWFWRQ